MERRGFIERIAKAAAGAMLSPNSLLGKESVSGVPLSFHPKVVKITDETFIDSEGNLFKSSFITALQAGFTALYADIPGRDFIGTLFPGLLEGASIGIMVYSPDKPSPLWDKITGGLIDALAAMPHKSGKAETGCFVPWLGAVDESTFGISPSIQLKTTTDFPLNKTMDSPLELAEATLYPCPALSRIHQFQIGLITGGADLQGENYCRDLFLSCFLHPQGGEWFKQYDQSVRWSLFERLSYPQGMKFRLFIVERIKNEKAFYLSGDGVILDKYFNFPPDQERDKYISLVELVNPSAPIVEKLEWQRRGSDNILSWQDEGYSGRWQVYREGQENFPPAKSKLIGFTYHSFFRDVEAAVSGKWYYRVTRAWGE